jgi:hypothetical protein
MTGRDRDWLRTFLRLDARVHLDAIPAGDVRRQEDTVLHALNLLDQQPGVMLADEVGMGKTFEALGILAALRHTARDCRVVIVTPGPDLNIKWENDLRNFGNPGSTLYDFGGTFARARTIQEFVAALREKSIVLVPISAFHSTRGGADQAYLLSLYCWWKKLPGVTAAAVVRRFRDGGLVRVSLEDELFLGAHTLEEITPFLEQAFCAPADSVYQGLDDLYEKGGKEAFENEEAVRRALDLARFSLVRALIPDIDVLVIDEAHKLKNVDTLRSQAVMTVFGRKFCKALFLTATPFQLDVDELRQVFRLFSLAREAPPDLLDSVETLFQDIRDYQHGYQELEGVWARLDAGLAARFGEVYAADPPLERHIEDVSLRAVARHVRELVRIKTERIQPGFRRWMIRSLHPEKRLYRRSKVESLKPRGPDVLPFLVYERFIHELFEQGRTTHKAAVEINMVSSYGAARVGALLADREDALPASAEEYRGLLRDLLSAEDAALPAHPKLDHVVGDALTAATQGEKTLIFTARTQTMADLAREIGDAWEEHLLGRWRRAYPESSASDIFENRHTRLRDRLNRAEDALYLALRERHLRTLVPAASWAVGHAGQVADLATRTLAEQRVGQTSVERIDYRLAKRCVEQAAVRLWIDSGANRGNHAVAIHRVLDPDFVRLGLDLEADDLEGDDADVGEGAAPPKWTIDEDLVALVVGDGMDLWHHLRDHLGRITDGGEIDYVMRVRAVERIARYLTRRDVTFLPDLLADARAAGLDIDSISSRPLLSFIETYWSTASGEAWIERLREFFRYFVNRPQAQRREILEKPIASGTFVRQSRDFESREQVREAFNTPLHPMVLVASEVMQEGLDLHHNCRRVIHHDLAWNPAQLEQRVGRVDRLGSLTHRQREKQPSTTLDVLYPLIYRTIDDRLYTVVKAREKWLEFLLGAQPRFDDCGDAETAPPELPSELAESLAIDLRPHC